MMNPHDGYCQPTCAAGCPEHYLCNNDGDYCSPDVEWAYPIPSVTWAGAVTGELRGAGQMTTVVVEGGSTITLTGSAKSPTGAAIVGLDWTTVSSAADYMDFEGSTIETTVPVGSYRRVELRVTDDEARGGLITVVFEACLGAGATCGYNGSGCCGSCDHPSDTCL